MRWNAGGLAGLAEARGDGRAEGVWVADAGDVGGRGGRSGGNPRDMDSQESIYRQVPTRMREG